MIWRWLRNKNISSFPQHLQKKFNHRLKNEAMKFSGIFLHSLIKCRLNIAPFVRRHRQHTKDVFFLFRKKENDEKNQSKIHDYANCITKRRRISAIRIIIYYRRDFHALFSGLSCSSACCFVYQIKFESTHTQANILIAISLRLHEL